jgi:inner membrane protein involved in colicin E2 resistance
MMGPMQTEPPVLPAPSRTGRRHAVTLKLLFIAGLVLLLQVPLHLVNTLNQERRNHRAHSLQFTVEVVRTAPPDEVFDAYRMVERALKHGVLVLALVFTAFFLFETLAGLRLHAVHYGLVGAALCLFYLALLALGEVMRPEGAYAGAAVASSLLITLYSGSILRRWGRAALIGGLLAGVHSVLFVVLRLEAYALLAGTGALFAALAAVMYFTRNIDWAAQDAGLGAVAGPEVVP